MAMMTPIALAHSAFSATNSETFKFSSTGGDQVVKNRLTIRNNTTNVVVYQNTVTSYLFQQEVPANTLTNGVYYNYYFNTYDVNNNMSADSNVIAFRCYSTPTITFTNFPITNIINSSSYSFDITYNQSQGELLDYLIYYLYDSNGKEVSNSGALYSSTTPPINFTHTFSGFEIDESYKIQIKSISVNKTQVQSELLTFSASYFEPNLYSKLTVENKCDEGYIDIKSNVVIATGEINVEPALFFSSIGDKENIDDYIKWDEWYVADESGKISTWAENDTLDLRKDGTILTYSDGFDMPSDFQYQIWYKPDYLGEIATLTNHTVGANVIHIKYNRGVHYGDTGVSDWYSIYDDNGYLYIETNRISPMSANSYAILWIKKVGNIWTTLLMDKNITNDVVNFNGISTVEYNIVSNYTYQGIADPILESPTIITNPLINVMFPVTTVTFRNGTYDNLDITKNTTRAYSEEFPTWNYDTILNCDFSSLSAGNVDLILAQVEGIKLKRRLKGTFDWIALKYIPVTNYESLTFETYDYFAPSGESYDYAIVPILSGGVEGDYIISNVDSQFSGSYICGNDKIFKFFSNVIYPTITHDKQVGIFQPLGKKYQITVSNAMSDGNSGAFSASVYGYDFEDTRKINRNDVVKQISDIRNYVTSAESMILKDWDGRIRIVSYTGGFSENVDLVSGKGNISFNWTETGQYNNQEDLYENGLTNLIE